MKTDIPEQRMGIEGLITFTAYDLGDNARAHEIDALLATETLPRERYSALAAELAEICPTRQIVRKNLVVLSGREVFARLLVADTTYTGAINYGALGSGNTAVASSDTVLDTEVKRKQVASSSRTNEQVNIDFYYSKSDTNGTYEEFGTFIDGTASADTGQLFNRVLTGGWTKSSSEAMTVSVQFNVNES